MAQWVTLTYEMDGEQSMHQCPFESQGCFHSLGFNLDS